MLSTIVNAAKSTQICPKLPKLPKTAKICLETISSRNFEIPPKIEILDFFKKKLNRNLTNCGQKKIQK
jgi:hypothetical protein